MSGTKACLSLPSCLMTEGKRMIRDAAQAKSGDCIKAQIRNAARNLGVEYQLAWRAYHGRIGGRAFPKLYQAFHAWNERHGREARVELHQLRERVARLERIVDRGVAENPGEARQSGPRPGMGATRTQAKAC